MQWELVALYWQHYAIIVRGYQDPIMEHVGGWRCLENFKYGRHGNCSTNDKSVYETIQ